MATVNISKIKVRRGTNDQRKLVVLDQGELAYTIDTKRLYLGTGSLSGGFVIGSKVHPTLLNFFSLSTVVAEIGDLVNVNNKFYQLTAVNYGDVASWADVGAKLDSTFLNYNANNYITLNVGSISAAYLNTNSIGDGLIVDNGILLLDYSTDSLEISANKLAIKLGGITEREIASTSLSSGLIGGSGSQISLDVDTDYFTFNGNKLSLSAIPTFPLQFLDLNAAWFGDGLVYDTINEEIYSTISDVDSFTIQLSSGQLSINPDLFGSGLVYDTVTNTVSATVVDADDATVTHSVSGLSLVNLGNPTVNEWPKLTIDTYGRVTNVESAVFDFLKADSSLGTDNYTNSLSSIFNGSPTGIYTPFDVDLGQITKFKALSSDDLTVVELSSAGFLIFEGNYQTRGGYDINPITRFAIPIFRF